MEAPLSTLAADLKYLAKRLKVEEVYLNSLQDLVQTHPSSWLQSKQELETQLQVVSNLKILLSSGNQIKSSTERHSSGLRDRLQKAELDYYGYKEVAASCGKVYVTTTKLYLDFAKEGGIPTQISGVVSTINKINSYGDGAPKKDNFVGHLGKFVKQTVDQTVERARELRDQEKRSGSDRATREMKLKREAEEADVAYRSSIFYLESLRRNKERVSRAHSESSKELFTGFQEEIEGMKSVYLSNQVYRSTSLAAVAQFELDSLKKKSSIPEYNFSPPVTETVTHYHNYFNGESSLIFGISLADYAQSHPMFSVPLILQKCITLVESNIETEGLYRVSSRKTTLVEVVALIEKNEVDFEFRMDEVATAGAILKLFLRLLPNSLLTFSREDRILWTSLLSDNQERAFEELTRRIKRSSNPNQATLKEILLHLNRVSSKSDINKMTASNLAVVFASSFFGEESISDLSNIKNNDLVMETLITHAPSLLMNIPSEQGRSRSSSLVLPSFSNFSSTSDLISPSPSPIPPPLAATIDKSQSIISPPSDSQINYTTNRKNFNPNRRSLPANLGYNVSASATGSDILGDYGSEN